jgi:hypothetical protein
VAKKGVASFFRSLFVFLFVPPVPLAKGKKQNMPMFWGCGCTKGGKATIQNFEFAWRERLNV